jgi:N-acyl-D-aspartate/D-glutamate deacylase
MIVIGAVSLWSLPVAQYPDVTPPTVQVQTRYPGASARTIIDTIALPIEQQVNGVENMIYMQSMSTSDGTYSLVVTFSIGTDLNFAQVLVQNRVSAALSSLPDAVQRLTGMPARVLGLVDRGTLEVGRFADVNVFDIDALASEHPRYERDFPNGAGRLKIGARGYAATVVNGSVITEQGTNTGERPGRVIREFARS